MNIKHITLVLIMGLIQDEKGLAYWKSLTVRQQEALKRRIEKNLTEAIANEPTTTPPVR